MNDARPETRSGLPGHADLLAAAADGRAEAWDELVRRFSGLLWSVVRSYRLGEQDGADAIQLTWLRLLEHLGSVRDPDRLPAWLATTCRRECLAVLRRKRRLRAADDEELDAATPPAPAADGAALTDALHRIVWEAFIRLDDRCQRLLRALIVEPDDGRPSYDVVGEAMGMPKGSLGPTRRRCLDRLREYLNDLGISGLDTTS